MISVLTNGLRRNCRERKAVLGGSTQPEAVPVSRPAGIGAVRRAPTPTDRAEGMPHLRRADGRPRHRAGRGPNRDSPALPNRKLAQQESLKLDGIVSQRNAASLFRG
jgi:hypothetical protein